jgi:hypothetical protein
MTAKPPDKTPPFSVGDQVRIVSPTADRGKHGSVIEVLEPLGDLIYRYRVQFNDGTIGRFFGFELELFDPEASSIPPARAS